MGRKARKNILIVEDNELFRRSLLKFLNQEYHVFAAESATEALKLIKKNQPDLILLDIMLPKVNGIETLKEFKSLGLDIPIIMLTAIDRAAKVVESIKGGAYDYLTKPVSSEDLIITIERALESSEMKQRVRQHQRIQQAINKENRLIGTSTVLQEIQREIEIVSQSNVTVLIEGETGTGKELIARAIHAHSDRANEPFIALNCGAIPKDLIESEFFGYKKGAFTNAQNDEIGKFQLANHGTLLLDEISELTAESQTKLLRVLEEQEFYPVGSTQLIKVDVRVITATNQKLRLMVEQNLFREDLYYRLNVYSIFIPPLRERPEDIIALAKYFMEEFNIRFGRKFEDINEDAEKILLNHSWKGNVRELRNVMERIALSHNDTIIDESHLQFMNPAGQRSNHMFQLPAGGIDLENVEKELIQQALNITNGNKTKAARLLNISPPTLYYRLDKYGIK